MRGTPTLTIRVLLLLALTLRLLPAPLSVLLAASDPLGGFATICHTDPATPDAPGPQNPAGTHDCVLCPACLWPASVAFGQSGSPPPLAPRFTVIAHGQTPPATGPPAVTTLRPPSRGPPV